MDFLGPEFERGADGGVRVNQHMQTTGEKAARATAAGRSASSG